MGTVQLSFPVSLSQPSGRTVYVSYASADGTALAGSGYLATSGTLSIPPLTTAATIPVPVTGDTLDEPNEALFLRLSSPVYLTLADGEAQGVIEDDDGGPALCSPILSLPYTIASQGRYCLVADAAYKKVSGEASTITKNSVVLDLLGHRLDGSTYRDELCARIGGIILDAEFRDGDGLSLRFDDGAVIEISVRDKDYAGPEALEFVGSSRFRVGENPIRNHTR
jgi:Calx-beta domain